LLRKEVLQIPAPADKLELTDPRAMRALAHPARLAILELLHAQGTANATECAHEVGGSPQAASYHLRALAKWGLVRPAESADGRETRWALAAQKIEFANYEDSPAAHAAARAIGRRVLEHDEKLIQGYIGAEPDEPKEWRDAATLSSSNAYLTAAELVELGQEVEAVLKRYERPDPADRPDGARRVHIVFRAFPRIERKRKRRK
jgi:DNA-binding transcriptional ArsR family regulator